MKKPNGRRKMKKPKLHCSHVFHLVKCTCTHPRYWHAGDTESERCLVRGCKCESFGAQRGYRDEQLQHETIPVGGYDDREQKKTARGM